MDRAVIVEVLENLIRNDINEALKPMDLQVGKIELTYDERLSLTINLQTVNSNLYV